MVQLKTLGLTYHHAKKTAYVLVLGEVGGKRRIPIVIGTAEAQSIALAMRGLPLSRPMAHDLLLSLAKFKHVRLRRVTIYQIENEVFYTKLHFSDEEDQELRLEARISDAVALAVRTDAPIYTSDEIIERYGIEFEEPDKARQEQVTQAITPSTTPLGFQTQEELESHLQKCIQNEDYEQAALIKAEINRRGGKA